MRALSKLVIFQYFGGVRTSFRNPILLAILLIESIYMEGGTERERERGYTRNSDILLEFHQKQTLRQGLKGQEFMWEATPSKGVGNERERSQEHVCK
jgi:hypothetical protein